MARNKKEREDVHFGNAEVLSHRFTDAMTSHIEKKAQSSGNSENMNKSSRM